MTPTLQPFGEFFSGFGLPTSFDDATSRVKAAAAKYQLNYGIVALATAFLGSWFYTPMFYFLIVALAAAAGAVFAPPLQLGGQQVQPMHRYGAAAVLALIVLWWTESSRALFYSVLVGALVSLVHAVMHTGSAAGGGRHHAAPASSHHKD